MLKIEIAGITVAVDNKYPYIEALARPYLTDKDPDFTVHVTDSEIAREAEKLSVTAGYAESVAVYGKIAEQLYRYDAFLIHAVAVEMDNEAYLIAAQSGVGKTTHARLWLEAFGKRASVLNGDKPIIRKIGGDFYAAATPWRGKERQGGVGMRKIRAIAMLERADENTAEPLTQKAAAEALIQQLYMPKTPLAIASELALADELVRSAHTVKIGVNMDVSAATVAYRAMRGNNEF